jgi:hypothetical protein
VVSQLFGVVIAFVGLWKTWHEFAEGERFRAPYVERARAIAERVVARARRMVQRLLRRPPQQIVGAGVAISAGGVLKARGRAIWGLLPEPTEAALAELHRRTLDLSKTQADAIERLDDAIEDVRSAAEAFSTRVDEAIRRLEALNRRVAVGGVRWEASGLFLVLLGLALQWISAISSAS